MIKNTKLYYFLGIGGIGMSAIARYLLSKGYTVFGYDKTRTELCINLENEGIKICYDDQVESIFQQIIETSTDEVEIIITPAIPKANPQLLYFKQQNYTIRKRAQILGDITLQSFNIAVAGTHGKTTTSSLLSHLMYESHQAFACFLGGISTNLGSNYFNNTNSDSLDLTIVEADEYDRSFHTLSPNIAIITSIDADHLDIYQNHESFKESFETFINKIENNGILIIHQSIDISIPKHIKSIRYGLNEGEYYVKNINTKNHTSHFELWHHDSHIANCTLGISGLHNIENAIACIAACIELNIDLDLVLSGLKNFKGVKRRFECISNINHHYFFDDYAHHPTEISAFLKSIKFMFPDRKITGIFQPHLFSRTKDFADQFSESLSILDHCILLPIYPARELPIAGVNSEMLLSKITSSEKEICPKHEIVNRIQLLNPEILLTMGAGDIDTEIKPLKNMLETLWK